MEIKKANKAQVDEIFKLGNQVAEFNVGEEVVNFWPKDILINIINDKYGLLFIAEERSEILGFIIANYNSIFKKAIIENIFVKKEHRRKQIGRSLLSHLLKELEGMSCEYVVALAEKNDDGQYFYTKSGFNKGVECVWLDKILSKNFQK